MRNKYYASDYRDIIIRHFRQSQSFREFIDLLKDGLPTLSGFLPTALVLFLGNFFHEYFHEKAIHYQTLFYFASNDTEASNLYEEIQFFFPGLKNLYYYPSLSELPGKLTPLPIEECHTRHTVIHRLTQINNNKDHPLLIITSLKAALEKIPSPTPRNKKLEPYIKVGDSYPLVHWGEILEKMGYRRNHKVTIPGEYAIKSNILDVFTTQENHPYRVHFWDEEVEMIKPFHPHTQQLLPELAKEKVTTLSLPSSRLNDYHSKVDEKSIKKKILLKKIHNKEDEEIINKWKSFQEFSWALLEPFLNNKEWGWTLLPALAPKPLIILKKKNFSSNSSTYKEFIKPYQLHKKWDKQSSFASPEKRFYPPEKLKHFPHIAIYRHPPTENSRTKHIHFLTQRPLGFKKDVDKCREYLRQESEDKTIFLFTPSPISGKKWVDFFQSLNPILLGENSSEIKRNNSQLNIICHPLSEGLDFGKQLLITDFELFRKKPKVSFRSLPERGLTEILEYFTDLREGDYVVHINQGIGRYLGLKKIKTESSEKDYLKIAYQGGDKLFVPVEQMNLVQRYIGSKGQSPRLDTLGGKSWDRIKQRVKKQIEALTKELINLYQERRDFKKIPCNQDDTFQEIFESAFPYQETEDQLRTTEEIKQDLESSIVMDRLLCGDVGFGKTEVAMRAIFKVVFSGRQAVVLVPTTILSLQHFQRFEKRFQDFPITIKLLNRFKDRKERENILKETADGKIEILIGTHALLSEKIEFKKLGLLVIDEEQKFGVKQKEKIKKNYPHVDTLSLSATPIPRTLHLSLSSIRALSILNTPPQNRQAVKTYVLEWDILIIKEAVKREKERGGQIFFVHNRVSTLASVASMLAHEMPEIRIKIAHGQMAGYELEKVMDAFIHRQFDMLVSTSIIESGMDLSRVNTLMVNHVDHFGLTQLYQLRGRVGRSNLEAYAYFFLPHDRSISENAMKRLDALTSHSELGAGFKISMSDLDIRGPGNILGAEQSGNIIAIGFELYTRLLNESLKDRNEKKHDKRDLFLGTLLELKYEGFIPHSYIPEDRQKIAVYKKIAAIDTFEGIDRVKNEIETQYGKIIPIIDRLLQIAEVRVYANQMKLFSIREQEGYYEITLFNNSRVNQDLLLKMVIDKSLEAVAEHPEKFKMPILDSKLERPLPFEIKISKLRNLLLLLKKSEI